MLKNLEIKNAKNTKMQNYKKMLENVKNQSLYFAIALVFKIFLQKMI